MSADPAVHNASQDIRDGADFLEAEIERLREDVARLEGNETQLLREIGRADDIIASRDAEIAEIRSALVALEGKS
jgi:chromosome segregation ATPase